MTDVLVVGAGPTGLTLALDLARRGVAVRIIDQAPEPFGGSRGKGLQERSLEVLADLGVSAAIEAAAWQIPAKVYVNGRLEREITIGKIAVIPQWRVEAALRDALARHGVEVEQNTPLTSFTASGTVVANGTIEAKYLVGCDGGHSAVRKQLGVPFEGTTEDRQLLVLADAEVDGLSPDGSHMWVDPSLGVFVATPFKGLEQWQLVVGGPAAAGEPTPELFETSFRRFTDLPDVTITNYTWMSKYRVNVRMVRRYRVGPVFLAGDAAHVHPPSGGLGMNTGIQDAYNLGWKLARAVAGTASPGLLDTYELERLPIAEWTLGTTNNALGSMRDAIKAGDSQVTKGFRKDYHQLGLAYPDSPLSKNLTTWDGPVAGERAPWPKGPDFTLLCFGASVDVPGVETRVMPGSQGVLVLVRPDGHIGMVARPEDVKAIEDYVRRP
jgi:2-polyprenyl-6-methoxyphenol hydroxylase-like FAD-dependent oxidoreductase